MNIDRIKSALPLALLMIATLIISCSKDESGTKPAETDARDLAVGTYTGLSSLTDSTGKSVLDTPTTFVVAKGSGKTLTITEDGTTIVTSDIVVVGKDFGGNIPSQSLNQDGVSITVKGKGNNNEQFAFQESQKAFSYNIEFTDGPFKGYTGNVFATKK